MRKSRNILVMMAFTCLCGLSAFTCEVPEIEVKDREFLLTKEWKAKEIIRTGLGDPSPIDVDSYRLLLNDDFTFEKIEFTEANADKSIQTGKWNLVSNQSQLEFTYDADSSIHRYSIIQLKLREIQMDWIYDSSADEEDNKLNQCSTCTRYILEPVKQ